MEIDKKTTPVLIDELITCLIKCFMAQEKVMHGETEHEIAIAAKQAQELNARRNKLIRAIEERMGESSAGQTEKTYG
jgi:hypothetical protein